MKKALPKMLLGVVLTCALFFGFLYGNNDIGKTANSLETDIRSSQKISDDWNVDGSISDTMAAFISYPQDKTDHTFSVYVNRPGLSFGYFFRGGGDIVQVDDYIAEFVVEGYNERAFISMNTQNVDTFVNAIFLYDDKLLLTFNFKDLSRTITFSDVEALTNENGSDLECLGAPKKERDHSVSLILLVGAGREPI